MAIIDYFPPSVAGDLNGNLARNSDATVYALGDQSLSTPLAITDVQGVPMSKLTSSALGIYPAFRVVNGTQQIVVVSGDLKTPMTSLSVAANAAELAAQLASTSAAAANSSASTAASARTEAVAAAAAAQAVGNTNDTIIEGRIKATGSKTELALRDKIVAVVEEELDGFEPGTPLAKVFFGTNAATARPDAGFVMWFGDPDNRVTPVHLEDGDFVTYSTTGEIIPAWDLSDVPGLAGHFDAQALSTADGANVTSWPNGVSGAGAAVPINSIPTMDIDGINGHRCLVFPNQGVLKTSGYSAYAGDHTIYLVARGTDPTDDFFFDAADSTPTPLKLAIGRSSTTFRLQRGSAVVGPAADTATHVIRGVFAGTTGSISIDDGTPVTGAIAAASTTTDYVIGGRADNANKLTGAIGEVIIVRGLVSSGNHAQIMAMLKAKWGL